MKYQDIIDKLKADLPGYHLEINVFPTGGIIYATACEECGTSSSDYADWRYHLNQTFDSAVDTLKNKIAQKLQTMSGKEG